MKNGTQKISKRVPPIYINNPGASRKARLRKAAQILERGMSDITCAALDNYLDSLAESCPELHREKFQAPLART